MSSERLLIEQGFSALSAPEDGSVFQPGEIVPPMQITQDIIEGRGMKTPFSTPIKLSNGMYSRRRDYYEGCVPLSEFDKGVGAILVRASEFNGREIEIELAAKNEETGKYPLYLRGLLDNTMRARTFQEDYEYRPLIELAADELPPALIHARRGPNARRNAMEDIGRHLGLEPASIEALSWLDVWSIEGYDQATPYPEALVQSDSRLRGFGRRMVAGLLGKGE